MKLEHKKPSQNTDIYWLFAINENYIFNKKASKRASGKWLIFESIEEIDETWERIKKATIKGLLGPSSKVSTAKKNPNTLDHLTKVICVFTEDYNNKEDVKRVENRLRSLDIENKLIYKLDKDVGKYRKDGHKNLIQEISYSQEYFNILKGLKRNPVEFNFQIVEKKSENDFLFKLKKENLEEAEYQKCLKKLKRLGFFWEIDKVKEIIVFRNYE